jgi:DNA-binding transcriptional LysR family regulator
MEGIVTRSGSQHDLLVLPPPIELSPVSFVMSWHRRNEVHPVQRWFRELVMKLTASISQADVPT